MQSQATTQPAPAQQSLLPDKSSGVYVAASGQAAPTNAAELKALRAKRSELSSQVQNVASRRSELADQLQSLQPGAQKGVLDRIAVLDARIVKLEQELASTGEALANAPASLLATETTSEPFNPGVNFPREIANEIVPIVAILSVFVLGPLTLALSRFIWRRAAAPPQRQVLSEQAAQQRLDQLQQAVDTIAIEVERISEGQRFISKALSDRALPAGSDARPSKASSAKLG